jgi:PAS domain S-box-containing protein
VKSDKKNRRKPPSTQKGKEVRKTIVKSEQSPVKLKRESEFYQTIIDNTTEGICVCYDVPEFPYVRFTVWNKRMTEITGYTKDEINARGWYQTVYQDSEIQGQATARMGWMCQGESFSQKEWEITRKDGHRRQILISTRIVPGEAGVTVLAVMNDITEQKRAEEALRESEQRFRLITDNMADVVKIMDMNLHLTYVSPSIIRVSGFTVEEAMGQTLEETITPDSLPRVHKAFEEEMKLEASGIADPERTRIMELEAYRKDGTTIWVEVNLSFIRDKDQKPVGILSTIRDINKRKLSEKALELSEEKFSKAFKASPAWVVISTLDEGRYLEVNDAFLKSTGFSREEVIGKTAFELNIWVNPEDRKRILTDLNEKGFARNVEVKLCKKSGEVLNILLSAEIIEIAGQKYMLSTSLDITERKKAEDSLRSSEERYRTLVESISDAILLLDTERRIVSCNQAFYNLYGYEPNEIIGKSVQILHRSDENFSSFGELAYPVLRKEGFFRGEWEHLHKVGTEIPVEVTLSSIKSSDDSLFGYVKVMRDITARKRAEKEMASLQEQLRQSQKMEAIGRLAGGIAHDFNNILAVIKGICDLSLLDLREGDPLYENLKEIDRSTENAAGLTRQLLAFSRKQIFEVKVLDLNQVIQRLAKMLRRILGEDIDLATFFTEELGRVKVDPGQMEQVIINLSVNARDAMPGGGKLTFETANVELDESYAYRHIGAKPGSYVMLSISDTGAGMTPEVRERIFEPFFTTKEKGKGTGLGLSTVYGIVKQSGGNVWVYSEPGKGTTFKIYLPRVDEPLEEKEEKVIQEVPTGSETVLVVEDGEAVRKLTVRLLKKQGYKVLEAPDGGQAFILCEQYHEPIHLILSDVVMPGINGRELVDRLQRIHPEARSLYMSGYTDNVIVHHGILMNGVEFIQKPFTLENLARKVREALDR